MAKSQKQTPKDKAKAADATPAGKPDAKKKSRAAKSDGWRETIESVVVAFILAFLFRTFEAEAFVIPTGSMAPTLYGRHKDVTCEKCRYKYAIGASDEVESGLLKPGELIEDTICPNCRYQMPKEIIQDLPVFKGDRILVNKFPYEFGEPKRFDVIVFKYPEEPQTNYIKRLIGLPGDKLEIRQGDVYSETKDGVKILRKDDPNKQNQLQILVYDNDYPANDLLKAGWPECWAPVKRDRAASDGWSRDGDGWQSQDRGFSLSAADGSSKRRWIRYRHFVPKPTDWKGVTGESSEKLQKPRPELITDFCGYNAYTGGQYGSYVDYGQYWVGDLTVRCHVNVTEVGSDAELLLELVEGFRTYRCRFNLETGECSISHVRDAQPRGGQDEKVLGTAATKLRGTGKHRVEFANVDDRLSVWVDGKLIDFGARDDGKPRTHYAPYGATASYQAPSKADLAPVGIAARDCSATVSRLVVLRDIYYRGEHVATDDDEFRNRSGNTYEYVGEPIDPVQKLLVDQAEFSVLNSLKHDPDAWWKQYSGGEEYGPNGQFVRYRHLRPARFPQLGPDEFFMMGDNSPRSKDSRLWPKDNRPDQARYVVKRSALVGKAFFTYWPHGIPFLKDGKGFPVFYHKTVVTGERTDYPSFRVPFYPNFKRMRRIR